MTTFSLSGRLNGLLGRHLPRPSPALPLRQPCLSELAKLPAARLPLFVRESEVAMKYLRLLEHSTGLGSRIALTGASTLTVPRYRTPQSSVPTWSRLTNTWSYDRSVGVPH